MNEKLLIFITLPLSTAIQSQLAFAKPVFLYFPPFLSKPCARSNQTCTIQMVEITTACD